MDWVSTHTPRSSGFLVLTAARSWAEDPASEWFPDAGEAGEPGDAPGLRVGPGAAVPAPRCAL